MIETWRSHLTKISSRQFRKAMNPHTEFLVPSTIHCWSFIQPLSHCPVCTPSSGMRSSLTSSVSQGHPPRVLVGRSSLVVTSPLQPRCPHTASRKMPTFTFLLHTVVSPLTQGLETQINLIKKGSTEPAVNWREWWMGFYFNRLWMQTGLHHFLLGLDHHIEK